MLMEILIEVFYKKKVIALESAFFNQKGLTFFLFLHENLVWVFIRSREMLFIATIFLLGNKKKNYTLLILSYEYDRKMNEKTEKIVREECLRIILQ